MENITNILGVSVAQAACAVGAICPAGTVDPNVRTTLTDLIRTLGENILQLLLVLAGALAIIYLMYSGIQYITSNGNPDKAKLARGGIINAIIGIAVIGSTYFIIRFAISIGNEVNCLDNTTRTAQCSK